MNYDDVIKAIGGCGRYQIFILNILYICTIFDGLQIGSMVFIIPDIKHRCAIPGLPNDTYQVQSEAHANLIKEYIPEETVDGKNVYKKCHLFGNTTLQGNQTLNVCTAWVYDRSIFQTTLTTDFNLVCHREWLGDQIFTVYFAGYLVAMLCCGWLSDRLGRKTIIIAALILQGSAGILSSQIKNYTAILIFRFITAIGGAGSYVPSVVFGSEISSLKHRTNASIGIQIYYTGGLFLITLLAYFVRQWKLVVLIVSLPSIPAALVYLWAVPESPRWLLATNKNKKAEIVLNRIAVVNKRDFTLNNEEIEISGTKDRTVRLWKIFIVPKLLKITLIMMLNWCIVSFVYFGLVLNSEHLSGDIYLNFFFGALVEIPAYILCMLLLNRIGRKKLYLIFMASGGLFGILTIFPSMYAADDLQWITTMFAILSKLSITGTFGIIYLHTCELYPTVVRNGALGAHSTFARLGGVIAPFIMHLRHLAPGKFGDSLPLLLMGLVCILGGLSYLFLPETNNKPMKDTFDDVLKTKSTREKDEHELEAHTALNPST